jgi:hypothetical protein
MLIETQYLTNTKKLVCSYVDKSGEIKMKYYDWDNPMKYVSCEDNDPLKHPTFKSWDGKSVKQVQVERPDRYAIYEYLDALPEEEQEELFEFNLPKIYFIDIETEIVDGFPEAADVKDAAGNVIKEGAATQVLSISIVYDDKIILLGLKDMPEDMQDRIRVNTNNYFKNLKYIPEYKTIFKDNISNILTIGNMKNRLTKKHLSLITYENNSKHIHDLALKYGLLKNNNLNIPKLQFTSTNNNNTLSTINSYILKQSLTNNNYNLIDNKENTIQNKISEHNLSLTNVNEPLPSRNELFNS